ncbi:MAG: DUF4118 domain-containing protein [Clostridia bacterium]|nr:DUF4118 domain-containing protein [Clostridia bacterium]
MKLFKRIFPSPKRNIVISIFILTSAFLLCFALRQINANTYNVPMILILAVFVTSRFTSGYFYGIVASIIGVLGVNYVFTYPYFQFNFTISGYPITIICMLAVSITTSMLTTQIKEQEKIKRESEMEKMHSNLLRSVSHDLRTPLTSILGCTSTIMESGEHISKDEQTRLLADIKSNAQWLIRMVENLLSITKINNQQAQITKTNESVEELVADCLQNFKKQFPNFNVTVSVPDDFLMVAMDAILIKQVILNLLENAAIHSVNATKTELKVYTQNNNAVFEVRDNGIGIDKMLLDNIFDVTIHHDSEGNSDLKKNMGIGLSVCNTIITAHNGTMSAKNARDGGAIFSFTLPL